MTKYPLSFQSSVQFSCLWVWWVCKISLWASIVFTFLKRECSFFSTGWLVESFNGLLTFFIFLAFISEVFYIKACYFLPSSLRHMLNLQLSSFAFKNFFFFFFFLTCYEIFFLTFFFFFFVACFCFAAQFLWSLGFDIKLYTGVHDALMLSLALVFEATLAFVLAIKLLQHLPLQHGHISCLFHKIV